MMADAKVCRACYHGIRDSPCATGFDYENNTNETDNLIAITRFSGLRQDLFISIKLKKI